MALETGAINSKVLENYFTAENCRDADVKKYDLNAKIGTTFSKMCLNRKNRLVSMATVKKK